MAGLFLELRECWIDSFPVLSGVYVDTVEDYTLLDGRIGYSLPFARSEISKRAGRKHGRPFLTIGLTRFTDRSAAGPNHRQRGVLLTHHLVPARGIAVGSK